MLTVEALAHEIRGGITIFCIIWSFLLFPARKQSRMVQLLFISTLWLSLSYLKDTVFIFEAVKNNIFVDKEPKEAVVENLVLLNQGEKEEFLSEEEYQSSYGDNASYLGEGKKWRI